jgi:hypothetical protein
MEQSSSWEANSSSATQEFPLILRNLKVHYRIQNSPPSIYVWVFQVVSFPQVSPLKPCMHL